MILSWNLVDRLLLHITADCIHRLDLDGDGEKLESRMGMTGSRMGEIEQCGSRSGARRVEAGSERGDGRGGAALRGEGSARKKREVLGRWGKPGKSFVWPVRVLYDRKFTEHYFSPTQIKTTVFLHKPATIQIDQPSILIVILPHELARKKSLHLPHDRSCGCGPREGQHISAN